MYSPPSPSHLIFFPANLKNPNLKGNGVLFIPLEKGLCQTIGLYPTLGYLNVSECDWYRYCYTPEHPLFCFRFLLPRRGPNRERFREDRIENRFESWNGWKWLDSVKYVLCSSSSIDAQLVLSPSKFLLIFL